MKKTILLVALLFSVTALSGCAVTTIDAEHTGYITAVEKNGLIWKTGRAYIKTELSSSQEDAYCVEDKALYDQLKEKSENKDSVTVVYKSELIVAPWRCDKESAIITAIK